MAECIYCIGQNSDKLSREHVISRAVLKYVYEDRPAALISTVFPNKVSVNIEQVVKDVCIVCNSRLSSYDAAGLELVRSISEFHDARKQSFFFSSLAYGWLLKTHLNYLRTIPNRQTGQYYSVDSALYLSIVNFDIAPNLIRLYIRGRKGESNSWDKEKGTIPFFSYSNWEFEGNLLFSYLRIKAVDTFVFLPSNNDYRSFSNRINKVKSSIVPSERAYLQRIPIEKSVGRESVCVNNSWPINEKDVLILSDD